MNGTTTKRPPAVIYCRSATADGSKLDAQEARCQAYAQSEGLEVAGVFRDTGSGSSVDRPALGLMLDHLRNHCPEGCVVLVDGNARLARGVATHLQLSDSIARAGGTLRDIAVSPDRGRQIGKSGLGAQVPTFGRDR